MRKGGAEGRWGREEGCEADGDRCRVSLFLRSGYGGRGTRLRFRYSPRHPATARSIAEREEATPLAPVGEGSASHPTAFVSRLTNTPEAADG